MSGVEGWPEDLVNEEWSELSQAIDAFHQEKAKFFDVCTDYSTAPAADKQQLLIQSAAMLASSLMRSVDEIAKQEPDERARVETIANFIIAEDADRIKHFRQLTENDRFPFLDSLKVPINQQLTEMFIDSDDHETFMIAVAEKYGAIFGEDLQNFMFLVDSKAEPKSEENEDELELEAYGDFELTPAERRRYMAKTVGRHALDVAKISAGVALGLWAFRRRGQL